MAEERFETLAADTKGRLEQGNAVEPEEIVGGVGEGDFLAEEEIVALDASVKAFLQFGEGEGSTVPPGEEFAVEHAVAG
jgi:hypothetical protein